jgi:hypothetical protein
MDSEKSGFRKESLGWVSYLAFKGGAFGVKRGLYALPLICRFKSQALPSCRSH